MKIRETIDSFAHLNVMVIGDIMMDHYICGDVSRISPEAPVPVLDVKTNYFKLGGAGNVALNIKSFGAKLTLCGMVGDDIHGRNLMARLTELGVGTEGIVVSQARPTTIKTRLLASGQHIVRVDEESQEEATLWEEEQLMGNIETLMGGCDVVIFEDYDKGVLTKNIIEQTLRIAKKRNIPTVVDPKKRNFNHYKNVTLFKPNLKELREGLKMDISGSASEQIEQAVNVLKDRLEALSVMVTLSEHGIYFQHGDSKVSHPSHAQEIVDVSGAGDTVISIAAMCTALKLPGQLTAALSNLGGGLVCQHVGVVPINKEELILAAEKLFS